MANFNISYIYNLRDKFSSQMEKINSSMAKNAKAIENSQQKMKSLGKSMTDVGKSMALKVSLPLIALGTLAVKNWSDQEQAVAQLNQALTTTGNKVGLTLQQLIGQSKQFQSETIFGDDTIIQNVTSQLIAFTNITGDNFTRLQKGVVDVTSRMYGAAASGESLKGMAKLLGKALADPVSGMGALGRAGVKFSEKQENTIKKLAETNRLGEAQALMLTLLESKYGGAAKTLASTGIGPLKNAMVVLLDSLEPLGGVIAKIIMPLAPMIANFSNGFAKFVENNPKLTKILVIIGMILAALAPILIVLGMITNAITILLPVFAVLLGPIGLIIIAITALGVLGVVLYKKFEPFRNLIDAIVNDIKAVFGFMKGLGSKIGNIFGKDKIEIAQAKTGMNDALQSRNGQFDANININAPKGAVQSVKTKEKKGTGFNLGFNMQESY